MLTFSPIYQERPWGSNRLAKIFGRQVPSGLIGESWELGELSEFHAQVAEGPLQGKHLGELWRQGILGGKDHGAFPFLVKWLDTAMPLSVQVHPNASTCRPETMDRPKTEAWFVAHAEPQAELWAGLKNHTDPTCISAACKNGTIIELLCRIEPQDHDMFLIPAGTVHALGAGFLILEVQEPSDTTFRLYDWDRSGVDNKPRTLHLDAGSKAITYNKIGPIMQVRDKILAPTFSMQKIVQGASYPAENLRVFVATCEDLTLTNGHDRFSLKHGEIRVAEHSDGPLSLASGSGVLITEDEIA